MAKAQKLPFLFTLPIVRYVEEIIREFEKRKQGILKQKILPFYISFDTYQKDEPFMSHSEDMRKIFVDYLENRDAIKFVFIQGVDSRFFDEAITKEEYLEKSSGYFETNFALEIIDIKPIKEIWVYHTQHPNPSILKGTEVFESRKMQYENGQLQFHKNVHRFQKRQVKFFEILWERRSHIWNGKETSKPEIISRDDLAKLLKIKGGGSSLKVRLHNLGNMLSDEFKIKLKDTKDEVLIQVKEV